MTVAGGVRTLLQLAIPCFLLGCVATHPMGLSTAEWNALTPQEQARYRADQYRIDSDRQARAAEVRARQEQQRAEQIQAGRDRIANLYANARFGDVVSVTIQGGRMRYANAQYPCEPLSFDLVRGERKEVQFRGYISQHGVRKALVTQCWARLSEDGNSVFLNDDNLVQPVVLVNDGSWERGRTYPLAAHGFRNIVDVDVSGMIVTVRYRDAPGAPQRMIIEHR